MSDEIDFVARNQAIYDAYQSGVRVADLAREHDLGKKRIYDIIRGVDARRGRAIRIFERRAKADAERAKYDAAVAKGDLDSVPIFYRELSGRSYNALTNAGFKTMGQVAIATDSELLSIPNLGRKSLAEIRADIRLLMTNGGGE